ncbi:MAG TPA: cyclodeaminase/cyclohydrolase family protein [Gaiellaceae bacterium]|nr:cyclodeaminase/cyclohydrolase family protein [Gaiellaceae bacterium]
MSTENYLELRIDQFLERLADGEAPGGGSAAALTVAVSAGLVAMVARASSESWEEAGGIAAQALAILEHVGPLARTDAEAWQDAASALRGADGGDAERRNFALAQKLERAAAVPLEIAELAADTAALAALAGERGDGTHRADAASAAALAAGAARAAAHLVEINLGVTDDDPRLRRVRDCERIAAESAARALGSVR